MIILKRDYLKNEEINEVVNAMINEPSAFGRRMMQIGIVAQMVCDLGDLEWETCNNIYDAIIEQGDIDLDAQVKNMWEIDMIVKEELGVDKAFKDFLNHLDEKLKNFKIDNAIGQMQELKDVISNA